VKGVRGDQVASQRGGLPKDMPFALIEPLRDLFKDEVRLIGREWGCRKKFW